MAAVDFFLKLSTVDGESQKDGQIKSIEIESFSWGASQTGSMAYGGGGGTGKVQFQDFHFVMKTNSASTKLFLLCSSGEHIPEGLLTCRKAGTKQYDYLKVKFKDLIVSSFQTGGSGGVDVIPMDQISLNFTQVEMEYFEQKPDGKVATTGPAGWNQKTGVKV